MKVYGFLFVTLLLVNCGKSDNRNTKPLFQLVPQKQVAVVKPMPGYDKYVDTCNLHVKDKPACICQAKILQKYLNDNNIALIAESGNDPAKGAEIMHNHPEIKPAIVRAAAETDRSCGVEK